MVRLPPPRLGNLFSGTERCLTLGTSSWVAIVDMYFDLVVIIVCVTVYAMAAVINLFL